MAQKIWGADKTLTLAELQSWVNAKESGYGPLTDIGHTAEGTAATFTYQAGAVAHSVLVPINKDQQISRPGKSETCRGQPFISGQLQWVAVFR